MKKYLMFGVVGSFFCVQCGAVGLGDVWGVAKEFTSAVGGFVGTTKVTPVYALHKWRKDDYGYYRSVYYYTQRRVEREPHTGAYLFKHRVWQFDGSWVEQTSPFSLGSVERKSYSCDLSTYDPWTGEMIDFNWYNTIMDFEVAVWAGLIVKTGLFPPGQPYTAQLKSVAIQVQTTCSTPAAYSQEVRQPFQINDTSFVTSRMPLAHCDYSWLMLCWVGDTYDY